MVCLKRPQELFRLPTALTDAHSADHPTLNFHSAQSLNTIVPGATGGRVLIQFGHWCVSFYVGNVEVFEYILILLTICPDFSHSRPKSVHQRLQVTGAARSKGGGQLVEADQARQISVSEQ